MRAFELIAVELQSLDMPSLELTLNGMLLRPKGGSPTTTLLQFVRGLGLTGTKEGCAEGDCGACTMAVLDPDAHGGPTWRAINACLVLLPMVHGRQVVTVEGIATDGVAHPAQSALVERLGSQCGFCTPGVVMSLFEACYRKDLDRPERLDDQLAGNLCRCTGYRPIRDAAQAIAGVCPTDRFSAALRKVEAKRSSIEVALGEQRFFLPTNLGELFTIVREHPGVRFVAGGTDLCLEITKRFEDPPLLCSLEALPELKRLDTEGAVHRIGAGVLLSDLEAFAEDRLPPLARMLRFFAARQIKNRGTVGGNLGTASPIGDLPPVLLALDATVITASQAGLRSHRIADFFLGYRKTALLPGEIILEVGVPALSPKSRASAYKVSKRQELDISAVSAAFWVELDSAMKITAARFAFGGMAAIPKRAAAAEASVLGQPFTEETFAAASAKLAQDFSPIDDHRGSAWYRRTVAENLLTAFVLEAEHQPWPKLPARPIGTIQPEPTR